MLKNIFNFGFLERLSFFLFFFFSFLKDGFVIVLGVVLFSESVSAGLYRLCGRTGVWRTYRTYRVWRG